MMADATLFWRGRRDIDGIEVWLTSGWRRKRGDDTGRWRRWLTQGRLARAWAAWKVTSWYDDALSCCCGVSERRYGNWRGAWRYETMTTETVNRRLTMVPVSDGRAMIDDTEPPVPVFFLCSWPRSRKGVTEATRLKRRETELQRTMRKTLFAIDDGAAMLKWRKLFLKPLKLGCSVLMMKRDTSMMFLTMNNYEQASLFVVNVLSVLQSRRGCFYDDAIEQPLRQCAVFNCKVTGGKLFGLMALYSGFGGVTEVTVWSDVFAAWKTWCVHWWPVWRADHSSSGVAW